MSEEMGSMMEFSEDIASAEKPKELPVGTYPAMLEKAEIKLSQSSGKRMVACTFRVDPENFPADYEASNAPDGVALQFYVMAEDNARDRYRIRQFCERIGVVPQNPIDVNDWLNQTANLEVIHEPFEGEDRARIKSVNAS